MGKIRDKKIIDERAARRRKRKKPERYRQKIRVPLPQAQRQPRSIELWENILPNHPAFVIGNAPSLDACDLSLLEGCFTIGVNRVYDRIDPIILFWQDISVWFDEHKTIVTLDCMELAIREHWQSKWRMLWAARRSLSSGWTVRYREKRQIISVITNIGRSRRPIFVEMACLLFATNARPLYSIVATVVYGPR